MIELEPIPPGRLSSDLTGQRFGKLAVEAVAGVKRYQNGLGVYFRCRCDCGGELIAQRSNLTAGRAKSCGCDRKPRATRGRGNANHPLRRTWTDMIERCYRPAHVYFYRYGERGVRVCERWRTGEGGMSGFECFVADMSPRPTPQHRLARHDKGKNYEPGNCLWVDRPTQDISKQVNVIVEIGGQRFTVAEWARRLGRSKSTIYRRIAVGWDPVRAVTEPVGSSRATSEREPCPSE